MSSTNIKTGQRGEDLATEYLQQKGYTLLHRNWRYKRAEVDIIAERDKLLVFVEVKTRKSYKYGYPEEALNTTKQKQLVAAANAYVQDETELRELRFDLISITLSPNSPPEILHIEDAFFPYQE